MITTAYIYNKVKAARKSISCLLLTPLLLTPALTSCIDTIILPDDKTVDEDFWQTKEDVASMVNAAYAAMASDAVIGRLIVWGDFRSDELALATSPAGNSSTYDALNEMAAVNMQTTNTFGDWASIYSVINRCNIVLERAEGVMDADPNYTDGDYQTDRSQMLALRALCYFYLVRNYRDVPYVTTAYMNSSQDMQVAQSTPVYVLDRCIEDLEDAAQNALQARGFTTNEWKRVGWMTNDGINALLADIYLWRASITHNAADYEQCVKYCDLVINSKKSQHVPGRNEVVQKDYPLANGNELFRTLYVDQNAEESIFELQSRSNLAICQYFFKYHGNSDSEGFLKATPIFSNAASKVVNVQNVQVFSTNDLRYWTSCYSIKSDGNLDVMKMSGEVNNTACVPYTRNSQTNYGGLDRNYIIYRLTDVMLMKAEALVQQVDTLLPEEQQKELLRVPFSLVQAVNTRALSTDYLTDSMTWGAPCNYQNYNKDQMELLVMQERLRELCFEGKRWYDLLRYSYRHVDYDQAKYDTPLVDLNAQNSLGQISADMKTLMIRGNTTDGAATAAKMQNEAYLYLPVPNRDIIVCPLLRQNPIYKSMNDFEKSY
ncbi:MAG: RagB/SusD family nutrient uptake outer membrane protein [Prevotella sp.]|nr:RagB/SusD family nutrient uptake outer membrane protein [Prevotella sp.]